VAEVKWIKIVTDIFDDEKILLIESMPDADVIIVIWFKLLCLAGKNNNSGVFALNDKIPYTDEMLSTIFRRKINTVRLALSTFEQFGMIEIINGVITIPKWGKHQNLDQLEAKKEYMRGYMQKYRQLQAGKTNTKTNSNANVSQADIDIDIDKDNKDIYAQKFNEFWQAYPKKRSKGQAEKAFSKLKPNEQLHNVIIKSLEQAKTSADWKKEKGKYIPYPATWLNAKGWEDEYDQPKNSEDWGID